MNRHLSGSYFYNHFVYWITTFEKKTPDWRLPQ